MQDTNVKDVKDQMSTYEQNIITVNGKETQWSAVINAIKFSLSSNAAWPLVLRLLLKTMNLKCTNYIQDSTVFNYTASLYYFNVHSQNDYNTSLGGILKFI